jgi:hypothetical protein
MTCVHLQQLYLLCQEHNLKLGGSDLIHLVCRQCGEHEVCPSALMDEYDARELRSVHDISKAGRRNSYDSSTA